MAGAQIYIELENRTSGDLKLISADLAAVDRKADAARSALSQYRAAQIGAARSAGDWARAENVAGLALSETTKGTIDQERAIKRLNDVRSQGASATKGGLAGDLKNDLAGMAANLVSVGAALTVVKAGFDAVGRANQLKASIDQTNASVALQVRGLRSQTQVLAEAQQYANRYKITQQELAPALLASTAILRSSNASVGEVLGTLQRLAAVSPEQGLEGAALAVKELQSGDIQSLVKRFEISRDRANEMKDAIKGGADAVEVLSNYLAATGVGLDALELRVTGTTGKINEAAKAAEDFQLALAKATESPFQIFLQIQTNAANSATSILSGDAQEVAKRQIKDIFGVELRSENPLLNAIGSYISVIPTMAAANFSGAAGNKYYTDQIEAERDAANKLLSARENNALAIEALEEKNLTRANNYVRTKSEQDTADEGTRATYDNASSKLVGAANASLMAQKEQDLKRDIELASVGMLGQGNQVDLLSAKYKFLTSDAQLLIQQQQQLTNAGALSDQRAGERSGGKFDTAAEQNLASNAARNRADREREIQDARLQYARTTGDTVAVQGILNQRLAEARGNQTEELRIKGELFQLNKKVVKEDDKGVRAREAQLRLEERIYDAKLRQLDASRNAAISSVENRTKTREEERDLAQARRVLESESAGSEQRAAAQERVDLIPLERAKRQAEIDKQLRESNGQIIDGQIYSSQQRAGSTFGGVPVPTGLASSPSVGGRAVATGGTGAVGGAGGSVIQVNVVIDGQVAGSAMLPYVVAGLRNGLEQAQAAGV